MATQARHGARLAEEQRKQERSKSLIVMALQHLSKLADHEGELEPIRWFPRSSASRFSVPSRHPTALPRRSAHDSHDAEDEAGRKKLAQVLTQVYMKYGRGPDDFETIPY